jgi:hypothetical protein
MKQKLLVGIIMIALLAAGFAFVPAARATSGECFSFSGTEIGGPLGPFELPAGATITITMTTGEHSGGDGVPAHRAVSTTGGTLMYIQDGRHTLIFDVAFVSPHVISYTLTEASSEILILMEWEYYGDPANSYTVTASGCEDTSVAGCDTLLAIPSQAVMGQFTSDATVYWAPETGAATPLTVSTGKTYRVTGQDATGQFRQIILECQFVWVPLNTVGPDPEPLWGGAPLPTTVVK